MEPDGHQNTAFDLLRHTHRRLLLACLAEHAEPITLPDAAEQVTRSAHGARIENVDPETVRRTYLNLYHTHVPKLVDADVVRYSQESDLIGLTDAGTYIVERMKRFRR